MEPFEKQLHDDLHGYLLTLQEVDRQMPECPDVEEKWESIARSYIPDGIREFNDYPSVSLGWMMYVGMAVAKLWDAEWDVYSKLDDLYVYLRDKRDYDHLDEYIREDVLLLKDAAYTSLEGVVGECASRVCQCLCGLSPPALSDGRGDAAETDGLSHDGDVITDKPVFCRMIKDIIIVGIGSGIGGIIQPSKFQFNK